MRRINEDIKTNSFKQVYLLTGSQDYLRHQYRDRLAEAILGSGDRQNLTYFTGKDISQPQIVDLAETLPFFADRRVIVIEDSGLCKGGGDVLADYLKAPCETTYFVFVEPETNKSTKLYKAIANIGYIGEFGEQDERTLRAWIAKIVQDEKMTIDPGALGFFIEHCGTDMGYIKTELDKLISYCYMRKVITKEDVKAICSEVTENRIFEMVDAVAAGKPERALSLYRDLVQLRVRAMNILSLIARQFNQLLQTKMLMEGGYNNALIAKELKLPQFVANKNAALAAKFRRVTLQKALTECVQTEEDIKSGRLQEGIGVEMLIVTLATRQKL